jgi:hypothetical protein
MLTIQRERFRIAKLLRLSARYRAIIDGLLVNDGTIGSDGGSAGGIQRRVDKKDERILIPSSQKKQ